MSKIEVDKYMIFFFYIYWHYFSISLVKNPKDQTGHKRGEQESAWRQVTRIRKEYITGTKSGLFGGRDSGYIRPRILKMELPGKRERGRPQRRLWM